MIQNTDYIKKLIEKYDGDEKSLLRDNPALSNLYIFSNQREGMIEWYQFSNGADILQAGADCGAITGALLKVAGTLTVLDDNPDEIEIVKKRYGEMKNHKTFTGDIKTFAENNIEKHYDYIVVSYRDKKVDKEFIDICRSFLTDDGIIIMAADNKYGVKAWSGALLDENVMSRQEIEKLFTSGDMNKSGGHIEWYYPVPDWKLPSVIYSDDYLPKPGELAGTISAYNDSKYVTLDVAKRLDSICRDNRFSEYCNSYIIVWSRHE